MAKAKNDDWQDITQAPLNLTLDTRSRPADLAPGHFRQKLNLGINTSGRLSRRAMFGTLGFGQRSDSGTAVNNWDFHRRGHARELHNLLFESTSTAGVKRLFAGTSSYLSVLDNDTSEWTDIGTGFSAGSYWKAAELQDKVVFTNNVDDVRFHTLGTTTVGTSATLIARGIRKAKVVAQFAGIIVLFNVEYTSKVEGENITGSKRFPSRVAWGNYLLPDDFHTEAISDEPVVAGFYDLDYGDEILNVAELGGNIYIYTAKSIWKMTVAVSDTNIFGFRRIYSDPKNRTGCLAFDNALLSTGTEHYWMAQESIYRIDQYLAAPERSDWLLKASGSLYEGSRRVDVRCCASPIGQFKADTKEAFFFYPRLSEDEEPICDNDWGIVLNTEWKTADYVDYGMSALVSFSRATGVGNNCKAETKFIGASTQDYCLKDIGSDFARNIVSLIGEELATDIPDVSYVVTRQGYYSEIIGLCPFGYQNSREKIVRALLLDHETAKDSDPINFGRLRIGLAHALVDPVSVDGKCAVLWHDIDDQPLSCVDEGTLAKMLADNQRPSLGTEWKPYSQSRYLYFHLKVVGANGVAPVGSDSAWSAFTWQVLTLS